MTPLRARTLELARSRVHDVLIVGAGINGAVSAACLAARGAKVALVDRGDFAAATSQHSSNLAWGGIKYLETFEIGLVRKLCVSRNHLIRSYPSTVQEIRFFVSHERGFRHGRLKLYLGALFYWLLGSFFTRAPRLLAKADIEAEEPIVDPSLVDGGFEYSDAFFYDNDARFVWGFVRRALDAGAAAVNHLEVTRLERGSDGVWVATATDRLTNETVTLRARAVVNACGPWVDALNGATAIKTEHRHVFSKGIHLIVRRLSPQKRVLTFFADDGRLFFVIPMGPRTVIGTTDTRVESPTPSVTEEDRAFVLSNINKRLRLPEPLTTDDVIAERCGVRPLVVATAGTGKGDWSQLSRKHEIEVDEPSKFVSVFGGKLTDCLNVGEEIAELVRGLGVELAKPTAPWYGEAPADERALFREQAAKVDLDGKTSSRSSEPLTERLWRRYDVQAFDLLEAIEKDPAEAEVLIAGAEYLRCEIRYAAEHEMIEKLDDFLRRRSKIALVMRQREIAEAPGLREACGILFGDDADARYDEYFAAG